MKSRDRKSRIPEYYGEGGRLSKGAADALVNSAYRHDCEDADVLLEGLSHADLAHAVMLIEEGVIPKKNGRTLLKSLLQIQKIEFHDFPVRPELGDVYNSKDALLKSLIKDDAGWLHAGRARREAVNIAYLLAVRSRVLRLVGEHIELANTFLKKAGQHTRTVMPDYTYLQHAHPTSLAHYMLTYVYPMLRDLDRLHYSYGCFNQSPAGSGSVNGSRLPLNRVRLQKLLGFDSVITHTRDAMWQPDIPVELMANLSTLLVNVNRFGEELQIWSTSEFNLVDFSDELSRASVIMPQKKNPYGLAYIRGLTGSMLGKMASFAAVGKSYSGNPDNRTFIYGELPRSLDKTAEALQLLSTIVSTMRPNVGLMRRRVMEGFSQATDLADLIMTERNVDYRAAHQIVGLLVRTGLEQNLHGSQITSRMVDVAALQVLGKKLGLEEAIVKAALHPEQVVEARKGIGGASVLRVREMISECRRKIALHSKWLRKAQVKHYQSLDYLLTTATQLSK